MEKQERSVVVYPNVQRRWLVFWSCFVAVFLSVTVVYGYTVRLIAYVSHSLLTSAGVPLADGSIVMIFGSSDSINNGMVAYGTNYIADSVQGNDTYIGTVRVDMPSWNSSNGTFLSDEEFTFDTTNVSFLYIRIFNTTNLPVLGWVAWNTSAVFGYTDFFGAAEVDFYGNYLTIITNNFVVIPEPSTGHLVLLFLGLMAGLRASMRKGVRPPGR